MSAGTALRHRGPALPFAGHFREYVAHPEAGAVMVGCGVDGPALFLFDIDGTILRGSTTVHRDAFAHAYQSVYGIDATLDGVEAAGRTDAWLLEQPLHRAGLSEHEIRARMPDAFAAMEAYVDHHLGDLRDKVLPGVRNVLADLDARGELLGLLTGNLRGIAMAKMRKAGLARYFDTGAFGEESAIRSDLVPVALSKASVKAGRSISSARTVVIGDTPLDVEAGKEHGAKTAGVATGPYDCRQLQDADADLVLASLESPATVERLLGLVD